jgi:hypothetical protein
LTGLVIMGNGAHNVGMNSSSASIFYNGGTPGAVTAVLGNGDRHCVAVDVGAKLLWIRVNSANWNNSGTANPATAAEGVDISGVTGDLYIFCDVETAATTGTLNTGATAFTHTAPSGFGNWTA